MTDPIVDEIRSTRERLATAAGGEIHSIAMAARKRQELSGIKTVTRPARKPEPSRNNPLQPSGGSGVSQKPLDCATVEDVRNFQLYLIGDRKLAYSSFNQAVCALRFLYTHTIRVPWPVTMVPFSKRPKTLPVVLGRQEAIDPRRRDLLPSRIHAAE